MAGVLDKPGEVLERFKWTLRAKVHFVEQEHCDSLGKSYYKQGKLDMGREVLEMLENIRRAV